MSLTSPTSPKTADRQLAQRVNWVYLAKSRVLKRLQEEVQQLAEDVPLFLR